MRTKHWAIFGVLALLVTAFAGLNAPAKAQDGTLKQAAQGRRGPVTLQAGSVARRMPTFSGGVLTAAIDELRAEEADSASGADISLAAPGAPGPGPSTLGCSQRGAGIHSRGGFGITNIRVNQDCTYRRQAEEQIIYNPADPNNLLAGQNDSRVGYNQCGIDYSIDNGVHWGDLLPPFRQKVNNPASMLPSKTNPNRNTIMGDPGTGHTYDAGSDPAVAFDSQGNGYYSCIMFDVNSNANGLYVTQSPAAAKGSFFYNITSRKFMVVEDNSPGIFHDKNFITADSNPNSTRRDWVYVTWTVFKSDPSCGQQPNPKQTYNDCSFAIYGSMSTDGARTWSTPEEISGASSTLCFFGNGFDPSRPANACDLDQGSEPRVLPNGNVLVIFNNYNTAPNNPNAQQLSVLCRPGGSSTAGTAHLYCSAPSKVGNDVVVNEPQCDFGRGPEECIPGPFIRTNDFPRLAVNPANGNAFAVWQDYRNGEYDIELSRSTDGGATWQELGTVNPHRGLDHYMPAIDLAKLNGGNPNGHNHGRIEDLVGVSFYRSERVPNENATPKGGFAIGQPGVDVGMSDYALAGGSGDALPYSFKSISPTFGPPNGNQLGFNGDYSGLTINRGTEAHPIWSDTRNANPFPDNGVAYDEDVYSDNVTLPGGRGTVGTGQIDSPQQ